LVFICVFRATQVICHSRVKIGRGCSLFREHPRSGLQIKAIQKNKACTGITHMSSSVRLFFQFV